MKREGASPRRRRHSVSALLPAALLISVLVAAPVATAPIARPDLQPAKAAPTSVTSADKAATSSAGSPPAADSRSAAAPAKRPGWSVSREAVSVLVLSYVGIGALAAAGIWSYVRRGRW